MFIIYKNKFNIMSVCNLFNNMTNASGNFMMFSQYVEDITRNYSEGETYKIVPTRFVALDIDYSKVTIPYKYQLNASMPKYFQNVFENGCAYLRSKSGFNWSPDISRNLFWNCMFDKKLIHIKEENGIDIIPEIVYYGDIDMHSYNEHKGMGYGEIYCYIPTNAPKSKCQVIYNHDLENRLFDASNNKNILLGHDITFDSNIYVQKYYYNRDYRMSFDDSSMNQLQPYSDSKYNINTIVVLYSIYTKENDNWTTVYENLPMGMYITGLFEGLVMQNTITKYVNTSYGSGTSYGLRICTRFSASPNGTVMSTIDTTDDNSINLCQLMTAMNENLSKMFEVTKTSINTMQEYKETLSVIKNNRTNVPYIREVNGKDFWFVNGKAILSTDGGADCCNTYSDETIRKRFENLMDDDNTNDYTHIDDGTGCDCAEYNIKDLASQLGLDPDNYPEGGYTPEPPEIDGVLTGESIADLYDVIGEFEKDYPNVD